MKPGLERITELLRRLGNPHLAGYRVVHITGTNGKGSTSVLVAAGLQAAGLKTGLYISPFIEQWRERIQVDGQPIPESAVAALVAEVRLHVSAMVAAGWEQPTEFEVTTAVACLYFARAPVEWAVLEVGLGGRYDATNVIPNPAVTCITNVALDHTSILGNTHGDIAAEKAGILKPGSPCITAVRNPEALAVITAAAAKIGVPLGFVRPPTKPIAHSITGQSMNLTGRWVTGPALPEPETYRGLDLALLGRHQLANAACAAAILQVCGVRPECIRRALAATVWPGRFEVIPVPGAATVVLDGAHNPAGAAALAATVQDYLTLRPLTLVLGMLADKQIQSMLRHLLPLAGAAIITAPDQTPRALHPTDLARRIHRALAAGAGRPDLPIHIEPNPAAGLERALIDSPPDGAILVTGSLYTVGPARTYLRSRAAGPVPVHL